MRCWFSMGKQYGREPSKRLSTVLTRRLEVCWMALDHIASPSRTSTSSARGSCISWRDRRAGDKFKLKFVLSEIDSGEDKFKLKFCHRQI